MPYCGSVRARDRVAQGGPQPTAVGCGSPSRTSRRASTSRLGPVQLPGQAPPGCSGRPRRSRRTAGSRWAGMVRVQSPSSRLQPVAGDAQPAGGARGGGGGRWRLGLVQGEQLAQLAVERRGPVGPEAAGSPVGDPAQVDLVQEAAQVPATRRPGRPPGRPGRWRTTTGRLSRNQASSVARLDHLAQQVVPVAGEHAHDQGAGRLGRAGRVPEPAGHVQTVAEGQLGVDLGGLGGRLGPGGQLLVVGQGERHGRVPDLPQLVAVDLEDEHVVGVVVDAQPARGRRGQVGVDLDRVGEEQAPAGGRRRSAAARRRCRLWRTMLAPPWNWSKILPGSARSVSGTEPIRPDLV